MKPGVFQGKKFPFTPKRRKKSLGSQCNNIIDTRHDLAAFRSKLANVSWLRSYIHRRKPHSTGIKLYCLADATSGYVVDMYLYTGRCGHLRRFGNSAGNYTAQQIMTMWAGLLPSGTILCADSFFGSLELARDLAAERHAFLRMTKRSTYGVDWAGELLGEGETATCTVDDARYAMLVFKNPKVGHKPPRVVPMLTNVHFPRARPVHRRSGNEVNPVVANYRQLSRGVDGVNQMALQMRQMGRQMTWTHAVRAFVLRYAVVNAYATCRSLGGGGRTGTMFYWKWDLIRRRFCAVAAAKPIHVPVRMPGRRAVRPLQPGQDPLRLLWVRQVVPCGAL